jgi:hypothetical protein
MYLLLQSFQDIQNDETHTVRKELAASGVFNAFGILGMNCCNFFYTENLFPEKGNPFFSGCQFEDVSRQK